jgi:predicted porin
MARGYNRLPLAAALLAAASSANAGISIPAGDWTLDIGGVVNAFYTNVKATGGPSASNIGTGLLPNVLAVSGSTRQNDLDVTFVIAIDPGGYTNTGLGTALGQGAQENRQAFFTFGDKSWGTVKIGKDLGVFASDAILNDMTLLGVGDGGKGIGGSNATTTLGGIGGGYIYADWKEQIAYTTPNMNGFSATVAVTQAYNAVSATNWNGAASAAAVALGQATGSYSASTGGSEPAFEGKISYDFAADAAKGHVWASGYSQKIQNILVQSTAASAGSTTANVADIGATVNVAGFGLTGYYYNGQGVGIVSMLNSGLSQTGKKRDSSGGYVQATYALPTATKIGVAYGESKLDADSTDVTFKGTKNDRWTVGAYHPLTKHVNLVAEYNSEKTQAAGSPETTTNTVSLGGILFF